MFLSSWALKSVIMDFKWLSFLREMSLRDNHLQTDFVEFLIYFLLKLSIELFFIINNYYNLVWPFENSSFCWTVCVYLFIDIKLHILLFESWL
jgi:hypothetical protein